MNEFSKQANMCKKSIDWWREESVKTAFAAEGLGWRYEIGELTEEELFKKT